MSFKEFVKAYKYIHKTRASWYHLQWRLFAIVVAAAAIGLIHNYLFFKFNIFLPEYGAFLGERFFYWFMLGILFGIVTVAAVFEGEFMLGVRRVAKEVESEARQEFKKPIRKRRQRR
ncbi:hypothetical protein KJ765_03520 [Candidatus Micrarchaeota archaeon]|nr:hypothetical protein [Candidatus Micrarchaeota archaeon]